MNINLTLLGQIVSFILFAFFCMRYVWPPLISAMEERQNRISTGLRDAEESRRLLDNSRAASDQALEESKKQAAQLVEQANKRALQIIEDAKDRAKVEGEKIKLSAASEIALEFGKAKDLLRLQLSGLVVQGAEKIIQSSVDKAQHKHLLESLISDL